jgi:hypothetical protein
MNKLIIILSLLTLQGCAQFKEAICDEPIIPLAKIIKVDPKLLLQCEPLQQLTVPNPSFQDYLNLHGTNAAIYATCKKQQDSSITFIKEMANIK